MVQTILIMLGGMTVFLVIVVGIVSFLGWMISAVRSLIQ